MVVVMNERATEAQIDAVISRLIELGMDVHRSSGVTRTVLGVVGAHKIDPELIGILDGVHEVLRISEPYKRASRTFKPEDTVVNIDDVVMRVIDVMLSFPYLLLALIIVAALGPSLLNSMIAIGIVTTPQYARLIRGLVLGKALELHGTLVRRTKAVFDVREQRVGSQFVQRRPARVPVQRRCSRREAGSPAARVL